MAIGTGPISAKRALAAEWTADDTVLDEGEVGYERDTGKLKVGDGATAWTNLGYSAGGRQGVAVADAAGANPTAAEFKALLDSLRDAGVIATA